MENSENGESLVDSGSKPLAWHAKVWPMPAGATNFPEQSLSDWPPQNTSDTGVCFSGGGARAMSAAMGQMRGLRELGLLSQARYMSCVSGGSWAGTIYTFAPTTTDDTTLLGDYLAPSSIVQKSQVTKALNALCMCNPLTLGLYKALMQFYHVVSDNTLWLRAIGHRFLEPFGKSSSQKGLNNELKGFTWNQETLASVLKRNASSFNKDSFYTVEERSGVARRPFLIDMVTLIWKPSALPFTHEYLLPVECTPYYSGIPGHYNYTYDGYKLDIGGGFVESFAFGKTLYQHQPASADSVWTNMGRPFLLSDMTGTSSSFFAAGAAKADIAKYWAPVYNYYPIPQTESTPVGEYEQFTGDGGNLDNCGILPMLLRQLKNIIVFANSDQQTGYSEIHGVPIVADMIPPLFGYKPYSELWGYVHYGSKSSDGWAILKVFESSQFLPLINKLYKAFQNGQTAMWKQTMVIAADNKLNIPHTTYSPNVLWVYNNPVKQWSDAIASADVRADVVHGTQGHGPLAYFPNYSTAFEDVHFWHPSSWKKLADMDAYQISMLANLSHWNVTSTTESPNGPANQDVFKSMF